MSNKQTKKVEKRVYFDVIEEQQTITYSLNMDRAGVTVMTVRRVGDSKTIVLPSFINPEKDEMLPVTAISSRIFLLLSDDDQLEKFVVSETVRIIDPKAFLHAPKSLSQIEIANPSLLTGVELSEGVEVVAESFETEDLRPKYEFRVKYRSGHVLMFNRNNSLTDVSVCNYENIDKPVCVVIPKTIQGKDGEEEFDVIEVEDSCFEDCLPLRGVVLPDSVEYINDYAFWGCEKLASINFPDSLLELGYGAFHGTGLTSVFLPKKVRSVEVCFDCCPNLKSIVVDESNNYYDSRDNCNAIIETATHTLVQGCAETVIPDTVKVIGSEAFYGCAGLKTITIPDSVKKIVWDAFEECPDLEEIVISDPSLLEDAELPEDVRIVTPAGKKEAIVNIIKMLGAFK